MSFKSLKEITESAREQEKSFWRIIMENDMSERMVSEAESFDKMKQMYDTMRLADKAYDEKLKSASALVGGDGWKMKEAVERKKTMSGGFIGEVMGKALKMGESNACMKRIVAAPTAGACGVLPAVLVPLYEEERVSEDEVIHALYTAAGIGQVIASRAFIAGAAGGCQAEIGAASAMAAGALVFLQGGDEEQISHGAAMALKNLLGLVCDPVAGLVEVPCVKRNVIGAVNALSSADMALAGITSRIPPDQVIDAMKEVGESMHVSLRETGEGGVANTPEARKIKEKLGM